MGRKALLFDDQKETLTHQMRGCFTIF